MTAECTVHFMPDDVRVQVPVGTTILTAANKAGVFVNSLCGGDGVCGRCRVIVSEGRISGGSTASFTPDEIKRGYVLACEGCIETDVLVDVPPETRLSEMPEYAEGEIPELADLSRLKRRGIKISPLATKTYLELLPPSLDNNLSDLQRLEHSLKKVIATQDFQMGLKVIRQLPEKLRKSSWKVTTLTGYRGALTEIVDVESGDTSQSNFCIAADIGTTTVVCHLIDLRSGQTFGQAAKYNSQARFGADVIRRIMYGSQGPEQEKDLREAIVSDLNELIQQLANRYRIARQDISFISAAGNTTMIHLLLSLPADNIRKSPYVGAAYALPAFRAAEVGLQIHPRGLLYCLPCVAGFVGADIVAGIFATGLSEKDDVSMLIDIGTNGEIVLGNKEFLICASSSAGPAFEGAECECGMRATKGAIDHIRLLDAQHVLSFSTIGSSLPCGISGTGYIDLIAEMLRVGIIDRTGRFDVDRPNEKLREKSNGELEYVIVSANQTAHNKDISISYGDIQNLLRAKGAIYAASKVLLETLNMSLSDLSEIMVAGAFGNFLNLENAVFIGMLPDISLTKLRFVGNASLAGAKMAALCSDCFDEILEVTRKTTYFELSTYPGFMEQFVSACFFPHTDIEEFPSVMEELKRNRVTV